MGPPMVYQLRSNSRSSPDYEISMSPQHSLQGNIPPPSLQNSGSSDYSAEQLQQQQQQQQPQHTQEPMNIEPRSVIEDTSQSLSSHPAPPVLSDTVSAPVADRDQIDSEVKMEAESEEGGDVKSKPWLKKKVPGCKVNKKLKRRLQNARLRKIVQPRNGIMFLNELKNGIKFTFQEHKNASNQTMFVAHAEIDGKTYTGQGLSKPLAKQNAAENAVKDLLLQKMADAGILVSNEGGETPEPMVQDASTTTGDTDSVDASQVINEGGETPEAMVQDASTTTGDTDSVDGTSEIGKPGAPEDDVPWGSLASFALYKLFTEWQSQGTHVPIMKEPTGSASQSAKHTPRAPMKKIPENPTERHPVMLLNQLRPDVEFKLISRKGIPPNSIFTWGVTVDGASYTGVAKIKKDAKKHAAKAALAGSFGIKYG